MSDSKPQEFEADLTLAHSETCMCDLALAVKDHRLGKSCRVVRDIIRQSHAAALEALADECERAQAHVRDHHLEACESCAATESRAIAAEQECERLQREAAEGATDLLKCAARSANLATENERLQRERDEARDLHADHCEGICTPPWEKRGDR